MIQYCKRCVMPSTRPCITFNEEGICAACQSYDNRKNVDYAKRWEELKTLYDKYRGMNGENGYDYMVAVSGGKDSSYVAYKLKFEHGMNPLCVTINPPLPFSEGEANLKNFVKKGFDLIEEMACYFFILWFGGIGYYNNLNYLCNEKS